MNKEVWLEMRSSMRRVLSLVMIFMMVFSSISFAESTTEILPTEDFDVDVSLLLDQEEFNSDSKLSKNLLNLEAEKEEKVRVIVEFQNAPIIETATKEGLRVTDLDELKLEELTRVIELEQEATLQAIESQVEVFEVHERFNAVFNGMALTVRYDDVEKLAALDNVKSVSASNVYERPVAVPEMENSYHLTNSIYANEVLEYSGEGMIVAIIDTGIDPYHHDMQLDGATVEGEMTSADVLKIQSENLGQLPGHYFTEKVPYGYNYMDQNDDIIDSAVGASMHGMHVAGTVAADGNIRGVAPKAQVLAMKVFGNDPEFGSTFGDVIIKAIDDSILLGADVMNLSLGSTSAFVDRDDPEQRAVTNATENGIIMAISAGNSAWFGSGSQYGAPLAWNPDIGVSGSPGLTYESLQVASVDNYGFLYENTVSVEGLDSIMGYGKDAWDGDFELVAVGGDKLGTPDNYTDLDVAGKIVLVSRGAYSFFDKTENAAAAGAAGIVVYDHGLAAFYKNQGDWSIPFMMISKEDGLALEALLLEQDSIDFSAESLEYANPASGQLSSFSSWGMTPDLGFKPDIAAPGGNIYSLANNNGYMYMSGTSMAAPHAAGGSALVAERIKEDFDILALELSGQELVDFAKNILMNTAVPVQEEYAYTSPRGQGAGSMDLKAALTTTGVVYEKDSKLAKVNLGEVTDKASFVLEIKNFGDEPLVYDVNVFAQAQASNGIFIETFSLPLKGVTTKKFSGGSELTGPLVVKPNTTKKVRIVQDFSNAVVGNLPFDEAYPVGGFVEGFVFLSPSNDTESYTDAINKALENQSNNDTLIKTLTDELAQLVIDLEELELNLASKESEILDAQKLVDEKQDEIDQYIADNSASVETILKLIGQIEDAEENLDSAMNAYNASKENLILNAREYSVATLLQGNYDYLSTLFNAIDEIEDEFTWTKPWAEDQRNQLIEKINFVKSVMVDYQAVVTSLTVEGFLGKSQSEREDMLKDLSDKVESMQAELAFIDSLLESADLVEYANWIENTKLPKLNGRISKLNDDISILKEEIASIEEQITELDVDSETYDADKAKLQNDISEKETLITSKEELIADKESKVAMFSMELEETKSLIQFHANIQEAIQLNEVILSNCKSIKEEAVIVDAAREALNLLNTTYDEMDLAVYDEYLVALSSLENEKTLLEDAVTTLKDTKESIENEKAQMLLDQTDKSEELKNATNLVKELEEAIDHAKMALKKFYEMSEATTELSIPFSGFLGDWDDPSLFDDPTGSGLSYYGFHGYVRGHDKIQDYDFYQEINAISPNGDGYADYFEPIFTATRNMEDFQVSILNSEGENIRTLGKIDYVRKHWYDGGQGPRYKYMPEAYFDGTVNYKVVEEGLYYLRYEGDVVNGEHQSQELPFYVDYTKPVVESTSFNMETKDFSINAKDNLSGIETYTLCDPIFAQLEDGTLARNEKGQLILIDYNIIAENTTGQFDLTENDSIEILFVKLKDYAWNVSYSNIIQLVDRQVPDMTLSVPAFEILNTREFDFTGTLIDVYPSETILIDNEVVTLTEDPENEGVYLFEGSASYDSDGKKSILVQAQDTMGNEIEFRRWFYIDSAAPTIELSEDSRVTESQAKETNVVTPDEINYVTYGTESINIDVTVGDNFPYLNVKVNNNVVFYDEKDFVSYEDQLQPMIHSFKDVINLEKGMNVYVVSAEDAYGTVTTHVYRYYLLDENEEIPALDEIKVTGDDEVQATYGSIVTAQYKAETLDQNDKAIVAEVEWSIKVDKSNEAFVSIDENGLLTVEPEMNGKFTIVAKSGDIVGEKEVTVKPYPEPVLSKIVVTGSTEIQAKSDDTVSEEYTAVGYDQYENVLNITPTWSVIGTDVEMENNKLLVSEDANGKVFVIATVENVSGQIEVAILAVDTPVEPVTPNPTPNPTPAPTPAPVVQRPSVVLNEDAIELEVGTEAEVTEFDLDATVTDTNETTVVWSSSDETVATVDENGLVTAVAAGTATITASLETGNVSDTATVEVFLVGDEVTPLGDVTFNQPYMTGYPDGTFKPEGTITRAELAVVYSKILGLNTEIPMGQKFGDVSSAHWAYNYVNAVSRTGIFVGYKDGTFRPDQEITRAELAATFSSFWAYRNVEVSTAAVDQLTDSASHWAASHIFRLYNAQVLDQSLTEFAPDAPALRGQVVIMINKLLGRDALEVETSKFSDVEDASLIGAIEAATSASVKLND